MSLSEEDIQASAAITHMKPRSLAGDTSHHLRSRSVLQVAGDLSGLAQMAIGAVPGEGGRGQFVSLLTEAGDLDADLFIVPYKDGALIDVHAELADGVAARLESVAGVKGVDRSAAQRWRVFGELPDQKAVDTHFETIRFVDSRRREMGVRVLREATEPEGLDWRHGRKWDGHAMRMGILPDHRCVLGRNIKPEEAGFHRMLGGPDAPAADNLHRRVLPVRIEPAGAAVPVMAGSPLLAEGTEIGLMLDHEGVLGIALVFIEPWRMALAKAQRITCLDELALITWPTWLSRESQGRRGPAGDLI